MHIGIPKETKAQEYRVALTPSSVHEICLLGHSVVVEDNAGAAVGFNNSDYQAAGANIATSPEAAYAAELVVKVKEPQPEELPLLHPGTTLFSFLHLAAAPVLANSLLTTEVNAIAYETVTGTGADEHLPLLTPMSEIAGRLAAEAAATSLHMVHGGSGILMGGVPGVEPAKVLVLGGGTVGTQAAIMSMGLGAEVTVMDISMLRLRQLDQQYAGRLKTRHSDAHSLAELTSQADVIVGAVLLPGKAAPRIITRKILQGMRPGSVLVDVAIDQGGCAETSRPTTHEAPRYIEEGIVHYCVTNIPSASARTATQALSNATLPYVIKLANEGLENALTSHQGLRNGLNIYNGHVTHPAVAEALALPYTPVETWLKLPARGKC
ncbi:MAG: alanine dehydrogenase [bacterium]